MLLLCVIVNSIETDTVHTRRNLIYVTGWRRQSHCRTYAKARLEGGCIKYEPLIGVLLNDSGRQTIDSNKWIEARLSSMSSSSGLLYLTFKEKTKRAHTLF